MSPERASAYRRVIQTISELGPAKLLPDEQDRIREAADTLIFSADLLADDAAREALIDVERLLRDLVDSGRWEQITANRLADDVTECGPTRAVDLAA